MDHPQTEQANRPPEPAQRAEWVKPDVAILEAGSAEAGDFASPDGAINS